MENKRFMKKILGFTLVLAFGMIFLGCDNALSNDDLVTVRVINQTGRNISDVRLTGSDGSVITVEEISRQTLGNRGQGRCWARQDTTYTLSWWCYENEDRVYAQRGGYCGRRNDLQDFQFNDGQDITIIIKDDDTWELADTEG